MSNSEALSGRMNATVVDPCRPSTPASMSEMSVMLAGSIPSLLQWSITARAYGWDDLASKPIMIDMAGALRRPLAMITPPTVGRPEVRVPVLSKSTWLTWAIRSSASPPRTITPLWAAFDNAAACGTGVAKSSAQGQATTHNRRMIFHSSTGNKKYHTTNAPNNTVGTHIDVNNSMLECNRGGSSRKV